MVTGTNMAGKSTFLRTVGVNTLTAQTLGFAYASAWAPTRMLLFSSIEKRDDLESGKRLLLDEENKEAGKASTSTKPNASTR